MLILFIVRVLIFFVTLNQSITHYRYLGDRINFKNLTQSDGRSSAWFILSDVLDEEPVKFNSRDKRKRKKKYDGGDGPAHLIKEHTVCDILNEKFDSFEISRFLEQIQIEDS